MVSVEVEIGDRSRRSFESRSMKMKSSHSALFAIGPDSYLELSDVERFGDGSGYRAWIKVSTGNFACLGKSFYFDALPKFIEHLRSAQADVKGGAELRLPYEEEFVRFEFSPRGHVGIFGLLISDGPPGSRLNFSIEADQSYCPPFLMQLDAIAEDLEGGPIPE